MTSGWLGRLSHLAPAPARLDGEPRMAVLHESGFWIAEGFAPIALASGQPAWLAVMFLCAGTLVHVVGEMTASG